MGKEGKKKAKGGASAPKEEANATAADAYANVEGGEKRSHKMEGKPVKLPAGGATEGDDGGLPSPDRVRITLDLDQGKLDGLPLADILAKLFVDDAGKGGGAAASTNKVRAKYTVQARKGRKMGEPIQIPLDIEITDLDRSQHLSLPQQQTLEHHRKKANARYSWARKRASSISAILDIQKITITLEVKISEDVDETEDEGRDADAKRGDASGEFANTAASENDRKKAAAKEKKKGGSGKKKRKDSKDGEGEGGDTSKPSDNRLTKTISGRRILLNGSKSTKPQHGDDSPTGFRKTFSLVDVRSFFKRDAKEDKEDKVAPKRDDPVDGKKKKKDKKADSAPSTLSEEIATPPHTDAKPKRPELKRNSGGLRHIHSEDDFTSKLGAAAAVAATTTPAAPKPAPLSKGSATSASTPVSFDDIPIPQLDEPWLLPELTDAERAGASARQKEEADEGEADEATTIPASLFRMSEQHPHHPIYFTKSGVTHTWQYTTFADVSALVRRVSSGLIALGMPPRARTAILSSNRLEWVAFCLGSMSAGAVPAALPTTSTTPETTRMLAVTQANVVLVEKREQCDALLSQRQLFPRLRHVVLLDGSASGYPADLVLTWRQLLSKGTYGNVNNAEFQNRLQNLQPTDLATLAFTSGTTGQAKCVMLSHRNLMFSACAIGRLLAIKECDSLMSFLPFAHVAEQLLAVYVPVVARCRIYFAESTAKLHRNMREIQPTLVFAPPELWRKIYLAIQGKVPASAAPMMHAPALSALWTAMGFARVRYAACAYGYLPEEVSESLQKLQLTIHEAYGQTETCGLTAVNSSGNSQAGTVGKVLPNTQAKIDADGQILVKGHNVFMGYLSEEAGPVDGWWATGDHGSMDAGGFVRLVGRRVELITSPGDKVLHPEKIENALKMLPAINNVIVFGHQKPYLTAVISLDPYFMARVSKEKGVAAKALYKAPYINEITVAIQKHVVAVNKRLPRGFPTLKRFTVLRKQFSLERDELTAGMQIRRFVVEKNYEKEIDKMYADAMAGSSAQRPLASSGGAQQPSSSSSSSSSSSQPGAEAQSPPKADSAEEAQPEAAQAPATSEEATTAASVAPPGDEAKAEVEAATAAEPSPKRGTTLLYDMLKQGAASHMGHTVSPRDPAADVTPEPTHPAPEPEPKQVVAAGAGVQGESAAEPVVVSTPTPVEEATPSTEVTTPAENAKSEEESSPRKEESAGGSAAAATAPSPRASEASTSRSTSPRAPAEPSPRAAGDSEASVSPVPLDELTTEPEPPVAPAKAAAPAAADLDDVRGEVVEASDAERGYTTTTNTECCSSAPETDDTTTETETEETTESEREDANSNKTKKKTKRRPHEEDDDSAVDGDVEHEEEDEPRSAGVSEDEAARSHQLRRPAAAAGAAAGPRRSVSPQPQDETEREEKERREREHEEKKVQLGLMWEKEKELSETEERKLEEERRAQARRELIERKVDMKSTMAMFQMLAKTSTAPVPHAKPATTKSATTKRGASSSSLMTSSSDGGSKSDRSSPSASESESWSTSQP